MTITALELRNKARVWKHFGDESLSDSNKALYHGAAAAFDDAADEITGLEAALAVCTDNGTVGMLRDSLARVTGLLDTWASDHAAERTSEIEAALAEARTVIAKSKA